MRAAGLGADVDEERRVAVPQPAEDGVRGDLVLGVELDDRGVIVEEAGRHGWRP